MRANPDFASLNAGLQEGMDPSAKKTRCSSPAEDFFGHPRALTYLFATEMWERFSYYGMRALLVLYMVKYLLLPGHFDNVIGLAALKHGLESFLGPLGTQPFSSQIYGLYTGLVYLTPLFGGMLADRVLGQHRTILLGASLMAIGHFMMAFESLFLFALLALILGNGAFKPNISAQVGTLYAPGDARRDRAYSIFYVGINLGALIAPLVCGTLGEELAWHYGFTAAGVGMTIAIFVYIRALPLLPPDHIHRASMMPDAKEPFARKDWLPILALLTLFVPASFFWATYEQQGNTMVLWADDHTDRYVNLLFWRGEIPVTWFQAFNPFLIILFTPFIIGLWARQAQRGSEPSTVVKMSFGCFGVAMANLIMVAAAWSAGGDEASWLWLVGYFVVITLGELYISPIGLSLVSKLAPAHMVSMLMGIWLATSFAGNFIAGWLGGFWSAMDKGSFFLMIAGIAGVAGAVILAFDRPLQHVIRQQTVAP
jgi:POT family proton-dependent oligopeptide transporter